MNKGKAIMAGIAAVVAMATSAATITDVTAKQRCPWSGKVYISYTLTGDVATGVSDDECLAESVYVAATDRTTGANYVATANALSGDIGIAEGRHQLVWDLNAQGIEFCSGDVMFTVAYKYYAKYCVVYLRTGAVSYMNNPPSGGFNANEYKTERLVLRLIKPGSFKMSGRYDIRLTKPYYCGIFEVTQKQYELVAGIKPTCEFQGETLPVDGVSYETIRGALEYISHDTSAWYFIPLSVDPASFMGKISARTRLDFDLPTEAQWEYACRAGTTSRFNDGGNYESNLKQLGRYADNGGAEQISWENDKFGNIYVNYRYNGPKPVGSYKPNAWGLYDMHGNVLERCFEFSSDLSWLDNSYLGQMNTNPSGCTVRPKQSGYAYLNRGGSYASIAKSCSAFRSELDKDGGMDTYHYPEWRAVGGFGGFRAIVKPQAGNCGAIACSGVSEPASIDSRIEPTVDAVNISWDASWIGGDANATVVIEDNGVEVMRTIGVGEFTHELLGAGRHDLTYTTYIDGVAQDEICSATVFKDWKYEVTNDCAVIVETSQTTGAVTIPSVIDGHPVIGIAEGLFAGCTNLTSVIIPSSVWDIGREAFKDCTGLRRVEAVKGLKWTLESQDAFEGCSPDLEIIYAPTAEVRDVVAKQRFPWNGKVDITYTLAGDLSAGLPKSKPNYFAFGVTASNRVDGTIYAAAPDALSGDIGSAAGMHHVVWDLNAQGIEFKSDDVVFTVAYAFLHRVEGAQNLAVVSGVRRDDALCAGDSASVGVNSLVEPTVDYLKIPWNAAWIGGDANATVVISDNGMEVKRATGAGEFVHEFSGIGRHELTYTTYVGGTAQDEVYTATVYAKWKYDVKDGGAVIAETTQTAGAITIPSTIDGHPVTGIAEGAFANCGELTSVKIPASVWNVGYAAFGHCTGLQYVEAARGLKSALEAQDAFEGCSPALEIVYFSTGEIQNVIAKQRFPWNGKVDITYTLTGDIAAGCLANNQPFLLVTATNRVDGTFYVAATDALSGDTGTTEGPHHVVWDMSVQGLEFKSEDVVFTVAYGYEKYGKYCVIDLSSGSYPISYLADVPEGGWTDEYKTTKLVLRLIWPGSFKMGGEYDVTLTKPYYCGVFEVTQKQYELVTGRWSPSYFTNTSYYATRPVENVSWETIRGPSSTNWPSSSWVDSYLFVGRIQKRTGLSFDLPTEAQWEYACRAGTETDYNNGKNNMGINGVDEIGRYSVNSGADYSQSRSCGTSVGTAKVGSYLPNAFGIYDMHGNVEEWCLNWYGQLTSGVSDPIGSSSGVYRVLRGGGWCHSADICTSSYRHYSTPTVPTYFTANDYYFRKSGFRLVGNVGVNVHEVRFDTERSKYVYYDGGVGIGWGWSFMLPHGTQIGTLLDMVGTPTKNGFFFAGWWTEKEGGTQVLPTTKVMSSVTCYPHWTGCAYVVTLDQQSGSGGTTNVTATYGSAMPSVTVPMRGGFVFMGYWSEPNGEGTQYYSELGTSVRTWDKANATSLYAKWVVAEKYTVTLDQQGGSGGTSSVMAMYSNPMPFIAVPTRSGYAFDGYWSGPDGSGTQYYTVSGKSAHVWDKSSATTLYAKWVEQ